MRPWPLTSPSARGDRGAGGGDGGGGGAAVLPAEDDSETTDARPRRAGAGAVVLVPSALRDEPAMALAALALEMSVVDIARKWFSGGC
jgi:hypothetical protein